MAYPSSIDSNTVVSGTSLLATVDHANQHNVMGSAMISLETKIGLGVGTPTTTNKLLVATGNGTSVWGGTVNNIVLGTPAVTGGTISGGVVGGTADFLAGTIQSVVGTHTTNNITAKSVRSATTTIDLSAATAPSSGQVLTATSTTTATWQTPDGWVPISDTLTYASTTTFTISGVDRTAIYTKGTRIKLTNSTLKYLVVTASSFSTDTTVTVTGGSDYALANTTISSPYYSYAANPQGYPGWFNWSPSLTGWSTAVSGTYRFNVVGTMCHVKINQTGTPTSNTTGISISAPITSASGIGASIFCGAQVTDNTTVQTTPGNLYIAAASSTINGEKNTGGGTFTNVGGKAISGILFYEI